MSYWLLWHFLIVSYYIDLTDKKQASVHSCSVVWSLRFSVHSSERESRDTFFCFCRHSIFCFNPEENLLQRCWKMWSPTRVRGYATAPSSGRITSLLIESSPSRVRSSRKPVCSVFSAGGERRARTPGERWTRGTWTRRTKGRFRKLDSSQRERFTVPTQNRWEDTKIKHQLNMWSQIENRWADPGRTVTTVPPWGRKAKPQKRLVSLTASSFWPHVAFNWAAPDQ